MQPPPPRSGLGSLEADLLSGLSPHGSEGQRVMCEHADRCGGCPVIALPYGEQLALKRGRVVQSASRYPALELLYTEPVQPADPITGYRTRAKLIVASGAKLGLYAKGGGHQVVDIPRCRVVSPSLAAVAALIRAQIATDETSGGPFAPYDPASSGALRAVDLREVRSGDSGDGTEPRVLITLVVQRDRVPELGRFEVAARALAQAEPRILGVAINYHEGESPQILGGETAVIYGVASAPDRIGLATHEATYGSFVQAHRGQAERVHTTVVDLLGLGRGAKDDRRPKVLDLYGGSGAIALALAQSGADVHLVESFAPAVAHVEEAARKSGLPVRAEAADVASALRRFCDQKTMFDAAVINPPRRGISPLAREMLSRLEVPLIAYVSCDPDTLARDLDHFTRLGYGITTLRPLDMIPLTDEVETIALLRRSGLSAPKVLWEDEEVLIVEKGAHEPTSPQGDYASSLVARARKLPGAGDALPVHRIDVGTSGLVVLAKHPDFLEKWQAVLASETSRKIYVAGARGVTPSKGAITRDLREDGKMHPARTRYRRLAVASGHSVLRVIPEFGRTHQIRRHLAAIGHPILGDDRYGHAPTNRFFEEKNALDRTFLHCVRLEFIHPRTQQRLIVEAPMPGDLRSVLDRTSGPGTLRFLDQKSALGQSGVSSIPPPPDDSRVDSRIDTGSMSDNSMLDNSMLDIDSSSPTIHPEMVTDDE